MSVGRRQSGCCIDFEISLYQTKIVNKSSEIVEEPASCHTVYYSEAHCRHPTLQKGGNIKTDIMKILMVLFVALLPVVLSAPVELKKRSKEVILFGNHQNKPRGPFATKKSDPSFDASSNPSLVDQTGNIHVVTPEENESAKPENDVSEVILPEVGGQNVEVITSKDQTQPEQSLDSAKDLEEVNNENADDLKTSDVAVEDAASETETNANSPEDGAGIAIVGTEADSSSKEDTSSADDHENAAAATGDDTEVLATPYKDELEDFYEYLLSYDNANRNLPSSSQRDGSYSNYYPSLYSLRRKRSSRRSAKQDSSHRTLKRARRIKRDLLDDKALYLEQYPVQERLPSDEELYEMFHSTAQNLQDLADLLDLYTEYQVPEAVAPPFVGYDRDEYEAYPAIKQYDGESELYSPGGESELYSPGGESELYSPGGESEDEMYTPVKREMLGDMPGFKKRFFYPSYDEPETHWGPFVTQQKKRADEGREESYQRLLLLAQALAGDQPSNYYYDGYYKKK
ncbi:uncharacterized protein LOC121369776 [Gigantopelta aegis]|uniref:uncharacterized protein LOC121369776 n=1 Tax=Gigantopelta aegis TaxID=1735272 RepID=UPI001B887662|nr:uncharacterized protein LOC121369776 [Gigantopelta aegis]